MCDYYDVLTAQTDDGDIPDGIWEQAVAEVDGECGYVLEFAPDSIAHRLAYRERAEEIVASLTTEDETVFPGFPTND
jgi:hypothetical protein